MEILAGIQKEILIRLSALPEIKAFYLTGGSALAAFYLGHRKSNDLDFFTSTEELVLPLSLKVEKALTASGMRVERTRGFPSFAELLVNSSKESTVIHIALESPFRFEPPRESMEFPGLKVDSLQDMAANKLLALFGRATLRDFVDVYFLMKEGFTKADLTEKAKSKDPGFDLYWLGVAFDRINTFSGDSLEMLMLTKPCTLGELRSAFNEWRAEIRTTITKTT